MPDALQAQDEFKKANAKFKAKHQRIGSFMHPFKKPKKKGLGMDLHTGIKDAPDIKSNPASYKKGGMVKKSGMGKVHKGEKIMKKRMSK